MQEVPPIQEVPPYTGSPALYRKSRPYTGSPAHTGSPALYRKSRPYTGSSAHLSSIILTGGVWYLLLLYTVGTESIQTPLNFSLCYIAAIC